MQHIEYYKLLNLFGPTKLKYQMILIGKPK